MRVSRHEMFMQMAEAAARRSTCYRGGVGAVVVGGNHILSAGYNGPPSGEDHCAGAVCAPTGVCSRAVHAEANALQRAGKLIDQADTIYCTVMPCLSCATLIAATPIRTIIFRQTYRNTDGVDRLMEWSLAMYRLTTGGYLVDLRTDEIR